MTNGLAIAAPIGTPFVVRVRAAAGPGFWAVEFLGPNTQSFTLDVSDFERLRPVS